MHRFSFRPALTLKGRKSFGLRGFAGKPFHPPLTDVPIGAYVLAAAFDVLSVVIAVELLNRSEAFSGYVTTAVGAGCVLAGSLPSCALPTCASPPRRPLPCCVRRWARTCLPMR